MVHQLDASFREKTLAVQARRRRAFRRNMALGIGGAVLLVLAVAAALTYDKWSFGRHEAGEEFAAGDLDEVPVFIPAIVDLAGDPMIINIGRDHGALPRTREVARPEKLAGPDIPDRLTLLSDVMLSSSERLMTTLPSSQQDFAFFQAQRGREPSAAAPMPEEEAQDLVAEEEEAVIVDASLPRDADGDVEFGDIDGAAGWGETVDGESEALPDFKRTRIENTTSVGHVTREADRFAPVDDVIVEVKTARTLDSVALEHGFSAADAKLAGEALAAILGREELKAGEVVALRGLRETAVSTFMALMQVSLYADGAYVGTLARADDGAFVSGADPWVYDDLFDYAGEERESGPVRQYRLLDAIYSTAARNGVPTGVIGEAIMLLSRSHDLDAFATHDDRVLLIYSQAPRQGGAGRVLYAAVHGKERRLECYVYRPPGGGDFSCMGENSHTMSQTIRDGMVLPVNGVMKSTFGPRRHPILKAVRIHKGVDWAAPSGTPVFAAFDGDVVSAGDAGQYGNLVRLRHPGGRETRYAHLDRFDQKARPGAKVKAGDVIGYVGTTGLSTGPHLHFELYVGGTAVDPLHSDGAVAAGGGSATEILVNQIIRVESGGNATAKNPLSSATGLGQFIDSTWLRMMRTYRPDLARTLSQADQLALRSDPTISREMVRNLAHEGESYLRARGHAITAGRLYLCHFLGMEGANTVLSAPADSMLAALLGQQVITANPFLTGKDAAYVIGWAENKMRGRRGGAGRPAVVERQVARVSPEFVRYKEAIDELVGTMAETL